MGDFNLPIEWVVSLTIIFATLILGYLFRRYYFRMVRRSAAVLQNNPTNYRFIGHALSGLIYIIGFSLAIYALPKMRSIASSLMAGAGILAVAVGFASQQALGNIVSGMFIIIFKPFRINDRLSLKDGALEGVVEDITLRHTVIRNFQNRRIIIPNSIISNDVVINADLTDSKICRFVEVSISYGSDIRTAKAIMEREVLAHPLFVDFRTPEQIEEGIPIVPVRVIALQDSGILLRANAWAVDSASAFAMGTDLFQSIKEAFDAEDIEIPFPHRKVIIEKAAD